VRMTLETRSGSALANSGRLSRLAELCLTLVRKEREMNFREFEEIFKDSEMKAWLAWDIVKESNVTIKEICTRSADILAQLYTVWYATPDGRNGDWRNSEDTPLRVGEALKTLDTWPDERRQHTQYFRAKFERSNFPVQLTLPAYAPNARDVILLDGTHRAAAAHLAGKDTRLIVFALHGPCDSRVLPDLMHYSA
jgi:hypothetical protein